jgi:sigma-E factor negative regulatory protein RseB
MMSPDGSATHPIRLLVWALLMLMPGGVSAAEACGDSDPEAIEWLQRMSRSAHETSYAGVVTLQRGSDDMRVLQLSHAVEGEDSSEQMTQLTGQGARVQREHHPLHCVHPGQQLLRASESLQEGSCGIARYYRLKVAPGERVAGREAVRVLVEPRDMFRYGYVLELDRETALLLKARVVEDGKRTLEQFQFADLRYETWRQPPPQVDTVHQADHPMPGAEMSLYDHRPTRDWSLQFVPEGFVATDTPTEGSPRRTYTDGLAVFSVFLEELDRGIKPGEGVVRQGSTTSYTRGMQLAGQPVLLTVVGEIPVNTARLVVQSAAWAP